MVSKARPESMLPLCGYGFRFSRPLLRPRNGSAAVNRPLLYLIGFPVLHAGNFVAIPFVDAVVELRAEMVVLGPLDWPAAQPLGVDLQVLHCTAHLSRLGGPAGAFQCGFNRHAADPAFGHGLCGKFRSGLAGGRFDFLMDWLLFLKQRIRIDDVEFAILQSRELGFGLEMPPRDVVTFPAELA